MRGPKDFSAASKAVEATLLSSDLAKALRPHMAKVRWEEVVGPQVAGVTQVEAVRDGTTLVVRVKNNVWANELILLKGDMLRRLNQALGGKVLTDIHFRASGLDPSKSPVQIPDSSPPMPDAAELARIMLSPEVRTRVETAVQEITDEDLRERIRATLTRAARIDEWKRRHGYLPCERCASLALPRSSAPSPHLCALCRAGVGISRSWSL